MQTEWVIPQSHALSPTLTIIMTSTRAQVGVFVMIVDVTKSQQGLIMLTVKAKHRFIRDLG